MHRFKQVKNQNKYYITTVQIISLLFFQDYAFSIKTKECVVKNNRNKHLKIVYGIKLL